MSRVAAIALVMLVLIMCGPFPVAAQDDDSEDTGAAAPNAVRVTYDRGFRFETNDRKFQLILNAGIQLRYTYVDYDDEIRWNDENYSSFYIRRARLWWRGYVFDPRLTYFFNIQLEPTRTVNAHDLWISYAFSPLFNLGFGRNKIAYGLGMLNSGWGLEFVERSVMFGETDIDIGSASTDGPRYPGGGTERFALSWSAPDTGFATGGMDLYRSQGVQLSGQSGTPDSATFEYQVGVWNGRGTAGLSNKGDDMLYAVRVGYHPWGWVNWFLQGDGLDSERYRLGILASAYSNSSNVGGGYQEHGYNIAVMNRYRGFSADFEWGTESFDYDEFSEDFDREGWRVSTGYFLKPRTWQVVARYAQVERLKKPTYQSSMDSGLLIAEVSDGDGGYQIGIERRISEVSLGVNRFISNWHQHAVKVDISRLVRDFAADPEAVIDGEPTPITQAPTQVDHRIRVMVQLYF